MAKYRTLGSISEEEIARILEGREGGRKAGRGDSPFTQEEYEKANGISGEEKGE